MFSKPSNPAGALMLLCCVAMPTAQAAGWQEFAIAPSGDDQENPDIHGKVIVWQEFVSEFGDYDICVADIDDLVNPKVILLGDANDQTDPAVYGRRVVWQSYIAWQGSADWDIWMADVTDFEQPSMYPVVEIPGNDEEKPAIHGNTVVWEDTAGGDYNVFGADITDPRYPVEFAIAAFQGDQRSPSVYRNIVTWQDNYFGDWDIVAADIWRRDKPGEFPVAVLDKSQQGGRAGDGVVVWQDDFFGDWDVYAGRIVDHNEIREIALAANPANQTEPDVDGHLVVWQDDRSGNWDIWAGNLITGLTFRITKDRHDQINPAISGNIVVWQDNRDGPWTIYGVVLDGPEVARCTSNPPGDIDGDCAVTFSDFTLLASAWLDGHLDPPRARKL